MSSSNVKMVNKTATGSAWAGPGHIKSIHVLTSGAGAANLVLSDGSGGDTKLDLDFLATADTDQVDIPERGIYCPNGIWVTTLANITSVTIFYI